MRVRLGFRLLLLFLARLVLETKMVTVTVTVNDRQAYSRRGDGRDNSTPAA